MPRVEWWIPFVALRSYHFLRVAPTGCAGRAFYGNGSFSSGQVWCGGVCLAPSADAMPPDACLRVPGGTIRRRFEI